MNIFNNIAFLYPQFLLLLLLLPAIIWWYRKQYRRRYATLRMSSLQSVEKTSSTKGRLRALLPLLRLLAFLLLVLALARPRELFKEEEVNAEGIDIMLVMDLSSSMLARDFEPDRLEVCKRVAIEFVEKRPYDRIGLSVFAGEAYTQCPLTTDHRVVKDFLSELSCGTLEDGTAIGMGLATAVNRLKESPSESKIVILLTDGVNNAGYIKPETAAEIAQEFDIKTYTIGVGTNGDALTPVNRRSDGQYLFGLARVEIDEQLLQQIAQMTGGQYYRALSEEGLEEIYNEIDRLEKTEIEVTVFRRYQELFHFLVVAAMLCLVLEILLRYTIFRAIP
ncbi:MAG TPA: VWA domain-containing protein [Saprospiraceae bacterium]|nr:VWA domain-containing protein [Saprospiraceae bacterium]